MRQLSRKYCSIVIAVAWCLGAGQLHAAEITDKQSCNAETDRVINVHMSKNLSAEKTERVDLIIRDLQSLCRREAFEAAKANIADADKLLK